MPRARPLARDKTLRMKRGVRLSDGVEKMNRTMVIGTSKAAYMVLMRRNVREGTIAAT